MVLPLVGVVIGSVALLAIPVAMIAASPSDQEIPDVGELAADTLYTLGWLSEGIALGAVKTLPLALVVVLLFNFTTRLTEKVVGEVI